MKHILLIYFTLQFSLLAQHKIEDITVFQKLVKKYIKTDELRRNDKAHLLDFKKYFCVGDSIATIYWKNKYWFFFSLNDDNIDEENSIELFNYYNSKLTRVTNRHFYKMISDVETDIKNFSDRLVIIQEFEEEENVRNFGLLIIDSENDTEERYIPLNKKSFLSRMYILNDSLYVEVQPKRADFNELYYLRFLSIRGKPEKYYFYDDGKKIQFIFNKNFELVSKKEIGRY